MAEQTYEQKAEYYAKSGSSLSTDEGGVRYATVAVAWAILHLASVLRDKK